MLLYFLTYILVFPLQKDKKKLWNNLSFGVLTAWCRCSILTPALFLFKMMTFSRVIRLNKGIRRVKLSGGKDRQILANVLLNNKSECVNVTWGCREEPVKQTRPLVSGPLYYSSQWCLCCNYCTVNKNGYLVKTRWLMSRGRAFRWAGPDQKVMWGTPIGTLSLSAHAKVWAASQLLNAPSGLHHSPLCGPGSNLYANHNYCGLRSSHLQSRGGSQCRPFGVKDTGTWNSGGRAARAHLPSFTAIYRTNKHQFIFVWLSNHHSLLQNYFFHILVQQFYNTAKLQCVPCLKHHQTFPQSSLIDASENEKQIGCSSWWFPCYSATDHNQIVLFVTTYFHSH